MKTPTQLRLLASANNARGDLFTRLTGDLFFALGYDGLRFDVHKSGCEIDIQGVHRVEPRRLVAECKAHKEKMGGADTNKLLGIVTREREKPGSTPVTGYFVSLSGFRETGIEQELQTSEQTRIILLNGQQVIDELIRIRILVSREEATERAGRCAAQAGLTEAVLDGAEVLGHPLGYLWAVYYSRGKQQTHFALIHADGTPLAATVAQEVIQADRECEGSLNKLTYLSPPAPAPDREAIAQAAVDRYRQWVVAECGEIQLDGLPADADLAAFRKRLERLFVPLKLVYQTSQTTDDEQSPKAEEEIVTVGKFLDQHPRFSLLAKPGGGKSTLLKRLAVAYADPARLREADDALPERDWLPLFLRCRELRDRAHRPIRELLDDLALHAGMNGEEAGAFRGRVDETLRSGRALLLIDGLDEISDEGSRTTFARHLRTFLAMFPQVAMVVTSREAGYRQVAGVIAGSCEQASLAPFDETDVQRLCERWHVEVVGDNEKVRSDAQELAGTIWNNERIRSLAENPLMLTTLLVVKRNVGELPTRRVKLYQAAVDVLIRTWNVEGYGNEPLDEDEALPHLSYVACAMMNEGLQQITRSRLLKLLQQARDELQAELQFASISPAKFIQRIEYRSSLLMQTGHERIDGELQPDYEFRHLTFQEYLAARGLVEEQYPGRDEGRPLVELLQPHFEDERWREVIPLAAVLAGRKAEPLIQRLTAVCESRKLEHSYPMPKDVSAPPVVLLRQCLLDEVQVTPPTLRAALRQMGRHSYEEHWKGSVVNLRRGRFGEVFEEVVEAAYLEGGVGWEQNATAISDLALESVFFDQPWQFSPELAATLDASMGSGDRLPQIRAAMVSNGLAFLGREVAGGVRDAHAPQWQPLRDALGRLLAPDDPPLALAAAWALVWTGAARLPVTPPAREVLCALFRLWREADSSEVQRYGAWAFSEQPLWSRDAFPPDTWGDCDAWLEQYASHGDEQGRAALVLAWYRRRPWTDSELVAELREKKDYWRGPTADELLDALGEPDDSN